MLQVVGYVEIDGAHCRPGWEEAFQFWYLWVHRSSAEQTRKRPCSVATYYVHRDVGACVIVFALAVGCAWTGHLLGLYVFDILHLLVPSPQMAYPPDQTGSPACPKRTIDEIYSTLGVWEAPWRDKQRFLQSRGYTLRPRYQHDWIPSWRKSNDENPFFAEDGIAAPVSRQRHHIVPLVDQARLVNI